MWKIALEIWKGISSAMIARAFLLAYRIMGKIIEIKGETEWLKLRIVHHIAMLGEIMLILIGGSCRYRTL